MGIERGEAEQLIGHVRAAYENQAREMIGPDADVIIQHAYQHHPKLIQDAIKDHVYRENPAAYDALVRQFWTDLPRTNPEALLNATNARELGVRKEPNGTFTVDIPGAGRMPWAAAVRAGFIGRPSRRK
jgi:hypothetical protein